MREEGGMRKEARKGRDEEGRMQRWMDMRTEARKDTSKDGQVHARKR